MAPQDYALARPLPPGVGQPWQYFGANPANYAKWGLAGHNGIDYATPEGSQVLAAHSGRCTIGYDPGGFGQYVKVINTGTGVATIYAHLRAYMRVDGEWVNQGELIGLSGNTGNSTGPHLHFGVKVSGVRNPVYLDAIDPYLFRLMHGDV